MSLNKKIAKAIENIKKRLSSMGINPTQLAKKVGIGQSTLAEILAGAKDPRLSTILKIAQGLNCNVGELLEEEKRPKVTPEIVAESVARYAEEAGSIIVPLLPDDVAGRIPLEARDVTFYSSEDYCVVPRDWVKDPKSVFCLRTKGSSMEPIIHDKSIVAINMAEKDPQNLYGKIAAVKVEDGCAIRRIYLYGEELHCIPDNPLGPENRPYYFNISKVKNPIIGKVVWVWINLN
ncbi:MAG: XRE family transcriptional regulator [Candidatus Brocadiales bacterium]|nr:XRE family transcriptional regulator [Candidatus Brocadiales bacterium]